MNTTLYMLAVIAIVGAALSVGGMILSACEWVSNNRVRLRVRFQNWIERRRERRMRRRLWRDLIKDGPSPKCERTQNTQQSRFSAWWAR